MAGVPRSMVSLASQRSSRTTSAPTANGHDSPRPRTDIARGAGPGSRSHAGQLLAAEPRWPGTAPGPWSPPGWSACAEPPVASFLREHLNVGAHRTSGHGPDVSRREGPPALQDRAGLGESENCQNATLAREARSDDQSDQLRHQAPRTTVQDRQTMASAPTPTPSEDGHPAARRSRLPEGLEGSGTGPVADPPHLRRGGPEEVAHGSNR